MSYIAAELRQAVIARAGNRCEYCRLSQQGQAATFHVDHIVPLAQNGPTTQENLALACVACSLYKGARLEAYRANWSRCLIRESRVGMSIFVGRQNESPVVLQADGLLLKPSG